MTDWVSLNRQAGLTVRPLDEWPGKMTWSRVDGPFDTKLENTLNSLKLCLRDLQATDAVLEIAIKPKHWRLDGLPRADAVASHPGVILSFKSKHGPLRFAFDKFKNWENNLRAIAMHLDHLRLAGLYGVGSDGQQYKGWTALPPGTGESGGTANAPVATDEMTPIQASLLLSMWSNYPKDYILDSPETFKKAYREAASTQHPDAGGTQELMAQINKAAAVLKIYHNLS